MAKYEIEVWSKSGKPLGNIRQFCKDLTWSKSLNDVETVTFSIDLMRYEELLEGAGFKNDPFGLLDVGNHDIRIKRNGKYLLGANIIQIGYSVQDPSITMAVSCYGYLNYYKTRYITASYTDWWQEDILNDVIVKCNAETGGDYGVRRGTTTGGHQVKRTRTYLRKEVKSLIQQMSDVINGPDFDFSPDKKFNVYDVKGVYRPSVRLAFPGNIQSFNFNRSIEKVSNFVWAVGSGNGDDAVIATSEDTASENALYRREKIATYNSVVLQDTLKQHANAVVHYTKDIIELPSVTVPDGVLDLNEVDVGDTVSVSMTGALSLSHINGNYRIQKLDVSVDDNDSETVSIAFDDIDIDDIISKQEPEE